MPSLTPDEIREIDESWKEFVYDDDDRNYDVLSRIGYDWRRLDDPLVFDFLCNYLSYRGSHSLARLLRNHGVSVLQLITENTQ